MMNRPSALTPRFLIPGLAVVLVAGVILAALLRPAIAAEQAINVVEKPDGENDEVGFDKASAERVDNPIRTSSTKDMVDRILGRLKEGDCIKELNIYGHGGPGRIATGKGTSQPGPNTKDQYIDGTGAVSNTASWEPELRQLKGKFCKDATVNLYGCFVGSGEEGAAKVWELAKLLNTEVGAAVEKVDGREGYPPHTEKNWQKATPDGEKPKPKKHD